MVDWTMVGGVVTALATSALAAISWYQLGALRKQLDEQAEQLKIQGERDKQWRTIESCERYTYDPVLRECKRAIFKARDMGRAAHIADPLSVKQDVLIMLNYFDALGIGVRQGVYLEDIVSDHLRIVVTDFVDKFVYRGWGDFGIKEDHIGGVMHLYGLFNPNAPRHRAAR